ncbi:MAG: restriction endonuclease [Candidatus Shapirobacteria bacterium]|nr:restriction endonuclease [Candidatus Shapirobacteria bacterium]
MNLNKIQVKKASGKVEAFSETKIRQSLARAGAKPKVINNILDELTPSIYDGITTKEIYRQVFELLNRYQYGQSYNYSLKEALMKLGPSGFPFEKFIGRLFEKLGYETKVSNIIPGQCLDYEIDVVAQKDGQKDLIECKFHNRLGIKTHSKDILALHSKFEDIKGFDHAWLVTNTKLTSSAIKYGLCKGIKMLAWRYPNDEGLEKLIEKFQLQPITILSFLNQEDCHLLFQNNVVVVSDLVHLSSLQVENFGFAREKSKQLYDYISLQSQSAELINS